MEKHGDRTRDFKKIDAFTQLLKERCNASKEVLIIGDYDADGICSSLILKPTIEKLTGKKVSVIIPDRFSDGYGIPDVKKMPLFKGVQVVTIDNGIEQNEKLEAIKKKTGMKPLVIDHHIYNKDNVTKECDYLDFHEAGHEDVPDYCCTGLAYKIARISNIDFTQAEVNRIKVLGGIGTIADVVKVRNPYDTNREIILDAFKLIKEVGVGDLDWQMGLFLDKCGAFDKTYVTTELVQFNIAPVINALGRIEMDGGQRTFDILDKYDADIDGLEALLQANERRKAIVKEAMNSEEVLKQINYDKPNVIVLKDFCEGCNGLIAQKVAELTGMPCLVCTNKAFEEGKMVGSGRNVEGWKSLYECLDGVDCKSLKFGGHESACGFSLNEKDLKALTEGFKSEKQFDVKKTYVKLEDYNTPDKLYALEPFGSDNPKPQVHLRGFVENKKILAGNEDMAKFTICKGIDAVTFTKGRNFNSGDTVDFDGTLGINEFGRNIGIQINIDDIQKSREKEITEKLEEEMIKE